jgi:hypothetical protein
MPKRLSEAPVAGLDPEVAAGAGAVATGVGVPLAAGMEAAIASMCAFSAFAPNPVVSVWLANCDMFETMLRLAFTRSSCPCSAEIRDCSVARCAFGALASRRRAASISA